ncbi:DNA-directed RNA polymerase [Mesorhizobium escarrei]|uniref:DNA-directed RNA polymerase n=1 Tax=Mesorhizobium escarrei TaxID=666018 RepID=A0ABN8JPK9_9HYPH|nr:DNA-directed RNA polymerase [Mesorhizobium escarrei]CAH2399612.1 DNA-directed RNA polymerase [Mesorhizobium escarrei]
MNQHVAFNPAWTSLVPQRQIELEADMAGLGAERFRHKLERDNGNGRGAANGGGRFLVRKAIGPLAEGVTKTVDEGLAGRPGRPAVAVKLLRDMDPDAVAYIAARTILNILIGEARTPLYRLALRVADAVEQEARFEAFAKADSEEYRKVKRWLTTKGSTAEHQKLVLTFVMNKNSIPWDGWAKSDCTHLGIKLVELFREYTGLIEIGQVSEQYQVWLTDKTAEWLDSSAERGAAMSVAFMPTIVPPKDWSSLTEGGYHTDALQTSLVKAGHGGWRSSTEHLMKADLTKVYAGINAIQRTPWQINRAVLAVVEALVEVKSEVAGLVIDDNLVPPPKPAGIDDDPEALKTWKREAFEVHTRNATKHRSKRGIQRTLINLASRFRDEPAIYFPHSLDFRGRAYAIPAYLQPQGSKLSKGLLRFAEGKPLGPDGARWLAIHGANCFGVDKVAFEERVRWVGENRERIVATANDPLGYFWWTEADSPWCFLAFCFEWASMLANPKAFRSHLPVALDGSCNGLQHFSAMLLDPIGGAAVNLLPSLKPSDVYRDVAELTMKKLKVLASPGGAGEPEQRWAHEWLHFGIDRKVTKGPVMALPYGITKQSAAEHVREAVSDRLKATGQKLNLSSDDWSPATWFLTKVIWSAMSETVVAAMVAMNWLQDVARVASNQGVSVQWETPSGFIAKQDYRKQKQGRVETKLLGKVLKFTDWTDTDQPDTRRHGSSISANYVHSMDAAAMILTAQRLANRGVTSFAMIHDSYGTHACDTSVLAKVLREVFIEMYQPDQLRRLRGDFVNRMTGLKKQLEPSPERGDLDLSRVIDADFFFA